MTNTGRISGEADIRRHGDILYYLVWYLAKNTMELPVSQRTTWTWVTFYYVELDAKAEDRIPEDFRRM